MTPKSARLQPRQRGFTLVELLVAISILGMIAVLGWRGLDSIVRARIALTNDLEQTRGMQLAFAQLQSDSGLIADATVLPGRPVVIWEQGRLIMVRKVYSENQPTQLQVVSYRLDQDALVRSESPSTRNLDQIDLFWQAAQSATDNSTAVILEKGIASMTVLTWSSNSWTGIAPAGAGTQQALSGLQVTLQLKAQNVALVKAFLLGSV